MGGVDCAPDCSAASAGRPICSSPVGLHGFSGVNHRATEGIHEANARGQHAMAHLHMLRQPVVEAAEAISQISLRLELKDDVAEHRIWPGRQTSAVSAH